MTDLLLDGVHVDLPAGLSATLTFENPYFQKSSSWSQDIALPARSENNRLFFQSMYRPDMIKPSRTYNAELRVNGSTLINGSAVVSGVSADAITVQLLGGLSAFNYWANEGGKYVDELDMGTWYEFKWPDRSMVVPVDRTSTALKWTIADDARIKRATVDDIIYRFRFGAYGSTLTAADWITNYGAELLTQPFTFLPFYNTAAGILENHWAFQLQPPTIPAPTLTLMGSTDVTPDGATNVMASEVYNSKCVQPKIWAMCEALAKASGYDLQRENNVFYTDTLLRHVVVVSGNVVTAQCNKSFPHWTVSDWWTELENTFAVTVIADDRSNSLKIVDRSKYFSLDAPSVYLDTIARDYSVEINDDPQTETTDGKNLAFDYDFDPVNVLPDDLVKNFEINEEMPTLAGLITKYGVNGPSDTIFRLQSDGTTAIFTQTDAFTNMARPGYFEVDALRPLIRAGQEPEEPVKLKFIPCQFTHVPMYIWQNKPAARPENGKDYQVAVVYKQYLLKAIKGEGPSEIKKKFSVDYSTWAGVSPSVLDVEAELVAYGEDTSDPVTLPDKVFIALSPTAWPASSSDRSESTLPMGGSYAQRYFYYNNGPWNSGYNKPVVGGVYLGLQLQTSPLYSTLGTRHMSTDNMAAIDTRKVYCFSFLSDTVPDVLSQFVIHGKKYVCQKIEATLTQRGLDKLMKGYFFAVG